MLPTEPPLSLHRLVAPVPPARPQETATAARQAPAPAPVSNATTARTALPPAEVGLTLMAGQDGVGNAAVATAALRAIPVVPQVTTPKT